MKISDIKVLPLFFERYIVKVKDTAINEALEKYSTFTEEDIELFKALKNIVYEEGKWTVRDILQHIIDNERIQSYRALRISRNDSTPLPGYDEVTLAQNSRATERPVEDLITEFNFVRLTTISLFKSMNDEMLLREGVCNNIVISPLSLGFVIVGHQKHHLEIISQRYKPLLGE